MLNKIMTEELLTRYEEDINPNGKKIIGIKKVDKETFFQYDFNNYQDFLDAIDVNKSELFNNYQINHNKKRDFIFRGEKSLKYDLHPTSMRKLNSEDIGKLKSGNFLNLNEISDFVNFIEGINHIGLNLSNESFELIKESITKSSNGIISGSSTNDKIREIHNNFPFPNLIKELALAQHYGINTRLLDFSHNPYKSLFFATQSIENFSENDRIGIWILPLRLLEICKEMGLEVDYVRSPNFQNKNMLAQEGVFVNYFKGSPHKKEFYNPDNTFKTLDQYLSSYDSQHPYAAVIREKIGKPMKFTLPHSEVRPIKRKLMSLNVNWLTIQPDLDGIKKHVEFIKINKHNNG